MSRWVGLLGQIRPINLLSSVKAEVLKAESPEHGFTSAFKKLIDKSFYAVGLCSRHDLGASTSIYLTAEKDGQSKKRTKGAFFQKLPNHDITLEAAWPELFVDRNSRYWELPNSISFDCLSLVSDSGLRYRFGIHKNGGSAKAVDFVDGQPPASLNPRVCAKAAFSYEKSKDLWRIPETKEDLALAKGESGEFRNTAYDISMKDPHATISGIFGGTCEAWLSGKRRSFGADLFGSICFAVQHGKFSKSYGDLTRLDARLDLPAASDLVKGFSNTPKFSWLLPD